MKSEINIALLGFEINNPLLMQIPEIENKKALSKAKSSGGI